MDPHSTVFNEMYLHDLKILAAARLMQCALGLSFGCDPDQFIVALTKALGKEINDQLLEVHTGDTELYLHLNYAFWQNIYIQLSQKNTIWQKFQKELHCR